MKEIDTFSAFNVIWSQFKQSAMDLHIEPELSTRFKQTNSIECSEWFGSMDFIWFRWYFYLHANPDVLSLKCEKRSMLSWLNLSKHV